MIGQEYRKVHVIGIFGTRDNNHERAEKASVVK